MVRAHARAIACGSRVRVLADGHLTSVIFTATVAMPEVGPVIPGIENRHQSGSIRAVTPRSALARSGQGAGCGLVVTGDGPSCRGRNRFC